MRVYIFGSLKDRLYTERCSHEDCVSALLGVIQQSVDVESMMFELL
jgi:hypothetical protein